jgi:ubiquinone/menaquinone biosynthesis C-methylase UbiE
MSGKTHKRSACAMRTTGVTLDHAAALYDWLAPVMTLGLETSLHRHVIAGMAMDKPMAVLDIGCGTGSLTRLIADRMPPGGGWITGIDAAEKMIAIARRKAGPRRIQFEAALAEDLPYPPASFDRVVSTFFFHHIDAQLKARAIAEIWRVLRPGGRAVILDVDIPYSLFGGFCAYAGYFLFRQPEIKENIDGGLRHAMASSAFGNSWRIVSQHAGYIALFELTRNDTTQGKDP